MKYFVISVSEDGDVSITEHTKEDLEKQLSEDCWPPADAIRDDIKAHNPNRWGNLRYLIIKGEIVVPEAVDVVVTRRLP